MTPDVALRLSTALACIGVAVSCAEELKVFSLYQNDGLLSWRLARLRDKGLCDGSRRSRFFDWIYRPSRHMALLLATLTAALASAGLAVFDRPLTPLIVLTLLGIVGHAFRSYYGLDGSDQMTIVVLAGLAIASASPFDSLAFNVSLGFVAAQLTLSYTVSGIAKLVSPEWRTGRAISGILSTAGYGNQRLHRFFATHQRLAIACCRSVIGFEAGFVLVVLALVPSPKLLVLVGVAFHAAIAVVMGLNNFFWAFASAYPPLAYFLSNLPTSFSTL